jgi:hypothetical protein
MQSWSTIAIFEMILRFFLNLYRYPAEYILLNRFGGLYQI